MQLLVTGATGKVGVNLIEWLLSDPRWRVAHIRALCHSRTIAETDRIEVVKGSIEDRDCVDHAMRDVTHVVHLATCKEIPETVMDVTVKGLFWLLEAFRQSPTAKQFMLTAAMRRLGISSTTIRSRSPSIRLIAPIPAAMLCRRSSRR
jgi:nucleoside-diphosphate-sugar epimerase